MTDLKRIFIMDDDQFYANILKQKIEKLNLGVVSVFDKEQDFFNHLNERPQVIILDYFLRTHTGLEVMKRSKESNPNAVCILLSSQSSMKVAVESLKMGAFGYVEKNSRAIDKLIALLGKVQHEQDIKDMRREILLSMLLTLVAFSALIYCWLK